MPNFCSDCGSASTPEARFCVACGHPLAQPHARRRGGPVMVGGGVLLLLLLAAGGFLWWREYPTPTPPAVATGAGAPGESVKHQPSVLDYAKTANVETGEALFRRCSACHVAESGDSEAGLGPNLWGVAGGTVASRPGFSYSAALRRTGGIWNWPRLDAYIRSPRTFAPGTSMLFAGMSRPQDRADLIAYLNTRGGSLVSPAASPSVVGGSAQ